MRKELGKQYAGTGQEVTFFLDQDDRTGEFFYIRSRRRGGALRLPLDSAFGQPFYKDAVAAAQVLLEGSKVEAQSATRKRRLIWESRKVRP